jgi:hypothetical protein
MTICMLREHLADYEVWRKGFYDHANAAALESLGITLDEVYRDADDANVVLVTLLIGSREQGEAILADPATRAAMEANGVDVSKLRTEWYEEPS